ncbi:hypothetical protein J1N35_022867 [Gossypium stocksii]|uniref:RNase H type-1 domain-containing protein n=1 Tax=Gossypium stocksii TaxID=47602 RepID=A0A9D4A1J6_9ROSI|nr:hypothetical protein J1N35_022867 [Gossypium stocksii]
MEDFITLIWNLWNNRNNFTFQGKEESAITIWYKGRTLSNDFRIYNIREKSMIPIHLTVHGWKKPARGIVKINVDVTIVEERMGLGVIVRDEGILLAKNMNIKNFHFEVDNANVVNKINRKGQDITFIRQRANDVFRQLKTFEIAIVTMQVDRFQLVFEASTESLATWEEFVEKWKNSSILYFVDTSIQTNVAPITRYEGNDNREVEEEENDLADPDNTNANS